MKSLAGKTRVLVWASFGLLFLQQLLEVWLGQAPWIIWLAVLLPLFIFVPGMLAVVVLFCSAMMYVRWRAQELRQASIAAGGHGDQDQ